MTPTETKASTPLPSRLMREMVESADYLRSIGGIDADEHAQTTLDHRVDPGGAMVSQRAMTAGLYLEAPAGSRLTGRPVARMNGAGNRITVLDLRGSEIVPTAQETRALAADPDLAFDQLMAIHDPREPGTDAFVSIFNTDGSLAGACGNGSRCVAWYLARGGGDAFTLATFAGRVVCHRVAPWRFAVDMGEPRFAATEIPTSAGDPRTVRLGLEADVRFGPAFALGMGNPHAVFFVTEDVGSLDLAALGAPVEHAPDFPERVNVSFAQVLDHDHIALRVWERGAGATLACGTGACATLVAAAATGRTGRTAAVALPGGTLDIAWGEDDRVTMVGPVELECEGVLDADLALRPA